MDNFFQFQYNSYVILSFFFLSLLVLILNWLTKGWSNKKLFSCYRSSFFNLLTYFRLFSHVLGHDGWEHFKNNFLIILLIGPTLEEKYGSINLLIMLLSTAFIGGMVHIPIKDIKIKNIYLPIVSDI